MSEADSQNRRGFRFVDLLVGLVLVVIALGLFIPAVKRVRDGDWTRLKCQNNLHQMGLGVISAHDQFHRLPPLWGNFGGKGRPNALIANKPYACSVWYHLLPYIEETAIWQRYASLFDTAGNKVTIIIDSRNPNNTPTDYDDNAASKRVPIFLCPSDDNQPPEGLIELGEEGIGAKIFVLDLATTPPLIKATTGPINWGSNSYAANALIFSQAAPRLDKIPDGTSKTILFTEKTSVCKKQSVSPALVGGNLWSFPPYFGATTAGTVYDYAGAIGWSGDADKPLLAPFGEKPPPGFQLQPRAGACDPRYPSSPHKGGINVCMADGSVKFISDKISSETWQAALTPGPISGYTYPAGQPPASDKLGQDWSD